MRPEYGCELRVLCSRQRRQYGGPGHSLSSGSCYLAVGASRGYRSRLDAGRHSRPGPNSSMSRSEYRVRSTLHVESLRYSVNLQGE